MNMEVKNNKALAGFNKVQKRKRASRCAAYFTAFTSSAKGAVTNPTRPSKRLKTQVLECYTDDLKYCCSRKAVLHNYGNFSKSALPSRVMYFWKGEWNDFPENIIASLRDVFQSGKSAAEVSIDSSFHLVDFLRMVQIDLATGTQRSIAWIDQNGKCFFPKHFFEGSEMHGCLHGGQGNNENHQCCFSSERAQEIEVKVEIGISGIESSKSENNGEVSVTNCQSEESQSQSLDTESSELEQDSSDTGNLSKGFLSKETYADYGMGVCDSQSVLCISSSETLGSGVLGDKLIKLENDDHEYVAVRNKYLAGLSTLVTFSSIAGIYRCLPPSSSSAQARLQAFQNHVEITRKFRGKANVRYAWHGTSRKGVAGIIAHGFGQTSTSNNGAAYGIGVYLSPEDCSHVSAGYSDVDENGLRHMVLCRVIMGNMEQVQPGSQQFHPSSEHFDSGVDDIKNPKRYIIWSTHMNTHILPEYVVSFKVSTQVHDCAGSKADHFAHSILGTAKHTMPDGPWQQGYPNEMARHQQAYRALVKEDQKKNQGHVEVPVKMPTSAWMPFPMLFSVIREHLSKSSIDSLEHHYSNFKNRKISREVLIKMVRKIAGDKLLIAAIKSIKSQKNAMEGFKGAELGRQHVLNADKVHLKNEFTSSLNEENGTEGFKSAEHSPQHVLGSEKVHSKNEFTSFLNETSVIGPSGLQGQCPHRPNSIIDAQQFPCKNDFTSHNGQALF
jgi:hypothetical protein